MVTISKLFQVIVLVVGCVVSIPGLAQCTWYPDQDADGFGVVGGAIVAPCNVPPAGYTLNKRDCNDTHFNDAEWKAVGTGSVSAGTVISTDLEIAADGTPYILFRYFTDPNPTAVVAVRKFDGMNWVPVGPDPVNFSDYMFGADMALDNNGVPYIAFVDQSMGDRVTVIKYNSANGWDIVGTRAMSAHAVIGGGVASLAIDGNNIPHVFYANASGDAFVMRYTPSGNAWQALGGGAFASVGTSEYMITIDGNGMPYVAFTESDAEISVMRFAAAGWEVVGSRSFSDNFVSSPRVQLDENNNPYAAYFDEITAEVIVRRYDATVANWVAVGAAVYAGNYSEVSLRIDRTNNPYVAHNGMGKLTVARWDGAGWADVANREFADALNISLAIAPDNLPYVSCRDLVNSDFASVKTIAPILVPPGTPVLTATATATCAGETTQLSIRSGNLNDAAQWVWYAGGCGNGVSVGAGLTLDVAPTITTTYYARAEGTCVPVGTCAQITINVTPLPTVPTLSASSSALCPGATSTLRITGGTLGNTATQRWAWYETTCGDVSRRLASGVTTLDVRPSANTTYYVRGEGSCAGTCAPLAIAVVPYPVVTLSAAPTVCAGESATVQVISESHSDGFQWQADAGGGTWADIPGATGRTLTRVGADLAVGNQAFRLRVENTIGCAADFLSSITVLAPPVIGAAGQPADVALCAGTTTAFTVTATGTGLVYQWQVDAGAGFNDITNGGIYAGATTSRLELASTTASLNGYRYRAHVRTVVGGNTLCSVVESDAATLTINPGPSIDVGGQPANAAVCPGGTATFGVVASGLALTYQWQEDAGRGFTNLTNGGNYSGVTSATVSIAGVPGAWTGRRYRVMIQGACGAVTSDGTATLGVIPGGSINAQPTSIAVCPLGTASFTVSTTAGGATYQWQEDAGNGFHDLVSGSIYTGVTAGTLVINNTPASLHQYRYRVTIQHSGCTPIISDAATLTLHDPPVVTQPPLDVALCPGESAVVMVTVAGAVGSYQWQVDDGSGYQDIRDNGIYSGAQSRVLALEQPPDALNGYRLRATVKWTCGDVVSAPAVLSLHPLPVISAGPDKTVAQRGSVVLEGVVAADVVQFEWMELAGTDQVDVLQPELSPTEDATYTLKATSDKGCVATDDVQVDVVPLFNIPNAFSPNRDGVNDTWVINGLDQYPRAEINVFNRYGDPVFTGTGTAVFWDGSNRGKQLPWGTYYYTIDLQDGTKPLSGWVLLMNER